MNDEHARVSRSDLLVIGDLYAVGNTSASMMGRTYPGSTLGPAMTFAFIAANYIKSNSEQITVNTDRMNVDIPRGLETIRSVWEMAYWTIERCVAFQHSAPQ